MTKKIDIENEPLLQAVLQTLFLLIFIIGTCTVVGIMVNAIFAVAFWYNGILFSDIIPRYAGWSISDVIITTSLGTGSFIMLFSLLSWFIFSMIKWLCVKVFGLFRRLMGGKYE